MSEMWHPIPEAHDTSPDYLDTASASLKVPGGTIYRTMASKSSSQGGCAISQTFVPDPPAAAPDVEFDDVEIRVLLSCKDVGSGREALRRLLRAKGVL